MPVIFSSSEAQADTETSNSSQLSTSLVPLTTVDHSGRVTFEGSSNASTPMASNRIQGNPQSEGDRQRLKPQVDPSNQSRTQGIDDLLQAPFIRANSRPPSSTLAWHWNSDLGTVSNSNNDHYEPQGELLQVEQAQHSLARSEFSIPHAVAGSGIQWRAQEPSVDEAGFAVPRQPSTTSQALAGNKRKSSPEATGAGNSPGSKRWSSRMIPETTEGVNPSVEGEPTAYHGRSQTGPSSRLRSRTDTTEGRARPEFSATSGAASGHDRPGLRRTLTDPAVQTILPARKVFPIQIGDKLFRLSGASISSDAPSYFSQFFEEQLRQNEGADSVRTLYIDRDPATFEDISLHLQGYHIDPKDGPHFVKLFADAQFFSLPRLTAQLFSSTIYIRIGDQEFQIPRNLFSNPGDSPNFFSLGLSTFFTSPAEAFPGISQRTLLRPPSIQPPCVPGRSARTFADLLHILKGYPVEVRSEEHRAELLRDARYFHLKGLEQRLIPHSITHNLARNRAEMVIRLEDIRQSGVSFVADGQAPPQAPPQGQSPASPGSSSTTPATPRGPGWVCYQRPYVDAEAYILVLEIGGEESTFLSVAPRSVSSPARVGRAVFHRQTLARITSLFSVIANKMNLPVTQPLGLMMLERGAGVASLPVSPGNTGVSEEKVKVRVGQDADVLVDGERWTVDEEEYGDVDESGMDVDPSEASGAGKRRHGGSSEHESEDWVVKRAQWRLRVQPMIGGPSSGRSGLEVILGAVKIEAYSSERGRNAARGFLA